MRYKTVEIGAVRCQIEVSNLESFTESSSVDQVVSHIEKYR